MNVHIALACMLALGGASFAGCETKEVKTTDLILTYNVLYDTQDNNYEIFSIELDGTSVLNLSINGARDHVVHAHGTKVYFISNRDAGKNEFFLYEMQSDGTDIRKVSDLRLKKGQIGSRRDGSELVAVPYAAQRALFYILNAEDGSVVDSIATEFSSVHDPIFSPNGKQIVFRARKDTAGGGEAFHKGVYIMNDDGTGLTQLVRLTNPATRQERRHAAAPRWNTAEDFISYHKWEDGKYSLFAVTPDGTKTWKLTEAAYNETHHDWSPDGDWLAVETFDNPEGQSHIRLVDRAKDKTTVLTDTVYKYQRAPVFVELELL